MRDLALGSLDAPHGSGGLRQLGSKTNRSGRGGVSVSRASFGVLIPFGILIRS
jgi:hypothetical protein